MQLLWKQALHETVEGEMDITGVTIASFAGATGLTGDTGLQGNIGAPLWHP